MTILVTSVVVHVVRDWRHAEGIARAIGGQVVQPSKIVVVLRIRKATGCLSLGVSLNASLRMGQVAQSGGVAAANGALLEVSF